jgi:predicted nucleic acid-binding protein
MKHFLPDVNTLLALLDPMHVHHEAAHQWYANQSPLRLVLCSHVENGVIRVASQPKYPNCLGTSSRVRDVLREFVQKGNTASCGKEVSLLDDEVVLQSGALTPSRISDLYLLALAAANDARFATFDTRIPAAAVAGGSTALEIIPVS